MYILLIAIATFSGDFKGKTVHIASDNMAVVFAIEKRRVHDKIFMGMVRELHFLEAVGSFKVVCHHISTKCNIADPISREKFDCFFQSFHDRFGHWPARYPVKAVLPTKSVLA